MISEVIFDVFLMGLRAKLPYEKHQFIVVFTVWEAHRPFRKNKKIRVCFAIFWSLFPEGPPTAIFHRFGIDFGSHFRPVGGQKSEKRGSENR
jgi:hypothetical protein